ncbi:hypothetical protein NYP20_11425 [Pseudomonas sp. N3-W]|uniref:hypothetical protein n=1 Tax=Pseudomonas sp. N3-W TaxID=2975049 RepID=UPI00217D07D1|nr:hypothetical protein [Pseudomonas sp. N3-W]UWF51533.1 hypothetical protein NYP20_11425 [Pseudomonas sp. N3-W]
MEAEPKKLITSTVGDTSIQVSELEPKSKSDDDEKIVTLTREGSQPITLSNFDFDVLYTDPEPTHAPNMIVRGRSGGANCCSTLHIISFSPSLHKQDIEALNADPINIQTVASGGPTLDFLDYSFAFWHSSFVYSPAPPISLSWDVIQGRYVLNVDGMRKPAPSNAELEEDANPLMKEEVDTKYPWPPTRLWADMLKYIYSGNSASARTLMNTAWQPKWGDKELFFTCFNQELHTGWLWGHMDIGNLMEVDNDFPEPIRVPVACGRLAMGRSSMSHI